jgi:hypothetical protein
MSNRTPLVVDALPTTCKFLILVIVQATRVQVRERDWANVITAHEGDPVAYTWRLQHFTLGEHELRSPGPPPAAAGFPEGAAPPPPAAPVSAVALSACGNFGVVGTAAGRVDRYNMQSGIHRGEYLRSAEDPGALPLTRGWPFNTLGQHLHSAEDLVRVLSQRMPLATASLVCTPMQVCTRTTGRWWGSRPMHAIRRW